MFKGLDVFMNRTFILKTRLDISFGIISLFPLVSLFIRAIYKILHSVIYFFIENLSLNSVTDTVNFYLSFIIPQALFPVLTAGVAFLIPIFGLFEIKQCVKSEKIPISYFILCIGIFPGLSMVSTYISYMISAVLGSVGVPVFDVSSAIPMPETPFQIFLLFFVMAVLPAICEELIYRGFLLRGISEFGKFEAVIVSSFAFGMMHATLQQIPFAFIIGLFLGYITLRFKSLVLPIILHFINNSISCLLLVLQNYLDLELVIMINGYLSLFFILLCLICVIIFIVLSTHDRVKAERANCEASTESEPLIEQGQVDYFRTVTHSWGFWLFVFVYSIQTIINIIQTLPLASI